MIKRFLFLSVVFLLYFSLAHSQSSLKSSKIAFSLELSGKYVWRGMEYGTAPVAFPMLSYNYKGFNVFAMGAYAVNGSHQEVDWGVSYVYRGITVGLSDYYYPSSVGKKDIYFKCSNHSTGHSVEAYLMFVPQKFPLWFTLSTYVYGLDKKINGSQAFSSYMEAGYTYNFNENNALSLVCGASLNKSFYTDFEQGVNVINVTLRYATAFQLGNFKLPVSASYILNPYRNKSFFTFSFYFNS